MGREPAQGLPGGAGWCGSSREACLEGMADPFTQQEAVPGMAERLCGLEFVAVQSESDCFVFPPSKRGC